MTPAPARDWTFAALAAAAFCSGFSMPLGRAGVAATALLLLADAVRGRRRLRMPAVGWLWLLLFAWTAVATWYGVNPGKGLRRLDKLLWYAAIPVAAAAIETRAQAWTVVRCLVLGAVVLAAETCIRNPVAAVAALHSAAAAGRPATYSTALIDQGSLAVSQRLAAGLAGLVALLLLRAGPGRIVEQAWAAVRGKGGTAVVLSPAIWFVPLPVAVAGLVLTFKRGSWAAAAVVIVCLAWRRIGWRRLLLGGLAAAALAMAVPTVRSRLLDLRKEVTRAPGGRLVMWTQVAPVLLREHPWGIGFRSLTPELMRRCAPGVEPNRDHLHSNPVEMAVSLGWLGLALYLAWMALAVRDAARADRGTPVAERGLATVLTAMLAVLLLNGLVEYNFADAEIVLWYGLLLGTAAAAVLRQCICLRADGGQSQVDAPFRKDCP
jgi:O-antigen ligase